MRRPSTTPVILYNTLSVFVVVAEAYVAGLVWEDLNLVQSPLTVTAVCSVSLAALSTLCLYVLSRNQQQGIGSPPRIWQVLKGCVLVLLSVVMFHLITVLYGAPLTEAVAETFHFSCLLAVLTVLPSCIVYGIDSRAWVRIYAHNRPESLVEASVQITTMCSLVGAWMGAFPIPLDWDRPWQTWPITCVSGALMGNVAGHFWSSYTARSRASYFHKTKLG